MSGLKFIPFLLLVLTLTSCKRDKEQVAFKALVNLQVTDLSKKKIELRGSLVFNNPSPESITYKKCVADINIDGVDLNTFYHKKDVNVKGNKEFNVPVYMMIEPKDVIYKDNKVAVVKISGEIEYENEKGQVKKTKFSERQTINIEVSKEKKKESKEVELSERELKKLDKKLRKGKIDSLEYKDKMK